MAVAVPAPDPAAHRAAVLFERHYAAVLGYCVWRLRTHVDAEEAAQTTFARALGALRRGQLPRNERAWLITIARNVCTTLGTARHRSLEISGEVPHGVTPERDDGLAPELEAALAGLPEGQRRALLLREWHELSYREIAAELGVSVATVESRIFRARRSLASALGSARRQLGLAGILRWLGSSSAAKVGAATVLATAVVAAEGPVEERQGSEPVLPRLDRPVAIADAVPTAGAHQRVSATRTTRAKRGHRAQADPQPPGVATERARTVDKVPVIPTTARTGTETPVVGSATSPSAPPVEPPAVTPPVVAAPALPLPVPELPPVQSPPIPALPAELPALPVEPPALPVDLPVDLPKLP